MSKYPVIEGYITSFELDNIAREHPYVSEYPSNTFIEPVNWPRYSRQLREDGRTDIDVIEFDFAEFKVEGYSYLVKFATHEQSEQILDSLYKYYEIKKVEVDNYNANVSFYEFVRRLKEQDCPIGNQSILGYPSENYDFRWKGDHIGNMWITHEEADIFIKDYVPYAKKQRQDRLNNRKWWKQSLENAAKFRDEKYTIKDWLNLLEDLKSASRNVDINRQIEQAERRISELREIGAQETLTYLEVDRLDRHLEQALNNLDSAEEHLEFLIADHLKGEEVRKAMQIKPYRHPLFDENEREAQELVDRYQREVDDLQDELSTINNPVQQIIELPPVEIEPEPVKEFKKSSIKQISDNIIEGAKVLANASEALPKVIDEPDPEPEETQEDSDEMNWSWVDRKPYYHIRPKPHFCDRIIVVYNPRSNDKRLKLMDCNVSFDEIIKPLATLNTEFLTNQDRIKTIRTNCYQIHLNQEEFDKLKLPV